MISNDTESEKLKVTMLGLGLDVMGGIASVEQLILDHCPDRTALVHITTFEYGSIIHKFKVFLIALMNLVIHLAFKKTDVIHIHFAQRGSTWRTIGLIWICKLFDKPIVLHAHASEFRIFFNALRPFAQKFITHWFRKAEQFIALSESWKTFYTETVGLDKDRVVILMNPVKIPNELPLRSDVAPISFIFLGRIGQRKGTFDLLEAIAKLPENVRDQCEINIAGDGEIEKATEQASRLGITNCVRILGWINADKRDELLAKSHAFILPSYNEGLPMSLLEAMGWGLPVIVTPVGGIPELITSTENGLLINPGDVQKLSQAMQKLIENQSLRLSLGNAARETVTPFDIKTYCSQLYQIYDSVLEDPKSEKSLEPATVGR